MKPVDPTECPECKHESVYTTAYYPADMMDPEAWMGRCTCSDDDGECWCTWES